MSKQNKNQSNSQSKSFAEELQDLQRSAQDLETRVNDALKKAK